MLRIGEPSRITSFPGSPMLLYILLIVFGCIVLLGLVMMAGKQCGASSNDSVDFDDKASFDRLDFDETENDEPSPSVRPERPTNLIKTFCTLQSYDSISPFFLRSTKLIFWALPNHYYKDPKTLIWQKILQRGQIYEKKQAQKAFLCTFWKIARFNLTIQSRPFFWGRPNWFSELSQITTIKTLRP